MQKQTAFPWSRNKYLIYDLLSPTVPTSSSEKISENFMLDLFQNQARFKTSIYSMWVLSNQGESTAKKFKRTARG